MLELRYSEDQPRDDHGRFGGSVGTLSYDISSTPEHVVGTQAMFNLAKVGDKLLTASGSKYTIKEKGDSTLKVFDHAANAYKEVSKTEVDKELKWGSRALQFSFNAGDPQAIPCGTIFENGVKYIPSYASYKAAMMAPFEDDYETVALADLIPTQDELWSGKLGEDPEFYEGAVLTVINLNGELLLWDGHHRAASALLAGQTELMARIYVIEQGAV